MSALAIEIRLSPREVALLIKMESIFSIHKSTLTVTECPLRGFGYETEVSSGQAGGEKNIFLKFHSGVCQYCSGLQKLHLFRALMAS